MIALIVSDHCRDVTYDEHIYQKLTILIISNMSDTIENVLILQGGGSLGAFAEDSGRYLNFLASIVTLSVMITVSTQFLDLHSELFDLISE